MSSEKDGGLVAQAVREALGTLVSPQIASQLVARALKAARLAAIPESGHAIATFVEGALRREIEATVSSDAAELVAAQLAPIVSHAGGASAVAVPVAHAARASFTSERPTGVIPSQANVPVRRDDLGRTARVRLTAEQMKQLERAPDDERTLPPQADRMRTPEAVRSSMPEAGRTARPQPSPGEPGSTPLTRLPRVLMASAEPSAVEALRSFLTGSANVALIRDLVGLLDALEEPGLAKPVVLIDCRRPTVHVSSVAAIGEDLPEGTAIVLWGASDAVWRELDRERVPSCRWVRCSQEATTEDLGSLCSMLIG